MQRPGPAPSLAPVSPLRGVFSFTVMGPSFPGPRGRAAGQRSRRPRPQAGVQALSCSAVIAVRPRPRSVHGPPARSLWGLVVSVVQSGEAPLSVCQVGDTAPQPSLGAARSRDPAWPGLAVHGATPVCGGRWPLAQIRSCSWAPCLPSASLPLHPAHTPGGPIRADALPGPLTAVRPRPLCGGRMATGVGKALTSFLSPV